ncbi:porin family protein [Aegicerativicinus sediminis]|uniref:porin family protein n=1 Tax=Aegicerativicinus sediminis TaxID=2893202 RepID=UPI001E446218|nr:porin family protein [Aegicerativicinus sediminis]
MRKIYLLTALMLCLNLGVEAQELHFGVKGGLNFSSIGGDETGDMKTLTSFHVGGLMEIMLNEQFSLQPELIYSAQGAKEDGGDGELNLDYLNVPVMAKYYATEALSIEAGPQFGILINSKITGGGEELDLDDLTKSFEFGLGVGLSYKILENLFVSGRYNIGLSNVWDDNEYEEDFKQHNNVIQLSVGYMF